MDDMKAVDLGQVMSSIRGSGRPNTVLWQAPDSIAFVARGREFRSEFHTDPSDEVMYMLKGDMNLHYRTPDGDEKIAVIREGQIVYCPAGTSFMPNPPSAPIAAAGKGAPTNDTVPVGTGVPTCITWPRMRYRGTRSSVMSRRVPVPSVTDADAVPDLKPNASTVSW